MTRALLAAAILILPGCTAAQGRAIEHAALTVGCALVSVLDPQAREVGTLCEDIAAAVELEIAASAPPVAAPSSLLAQRHRSRRVRVRDSAPMRDAGETIDEQHLPAVLRVLARTEAGR